MKMKKRKKRGIRRRKGRYTKQYLRDLKKIIMKKKKLSHSLLDERKEKKIASHPKTKGIHEYTFFFFRKPNKLENNKCQQKTQPHQPLELLIAYVYIAKNKKARNFKLQSKTTE